MKRSGLINLICSLIAVTVIGVAVILTLVFCGVIAVEKTPLVISSESSTVTYNGKELRNGGWQIDEGSLRKGHSIQVNVTGSQTGVGLSENFIIAKIVDKSGVDVTDEYNITYVPGVLRVNARSITVIAGSNMKPYDGKPLGTNGYSVVPSVSLIQNHTLDVTVEGSITEIGRTDSLITKVVIYNANGEDVTKNYNVKPVSGKLIVYSADSIVITSASDNKIYDGKPLTNKSWKMVSGELLDGHKIFVDVYGSITEIGTVDNEFDVVIKDENGNDVTYMYSVVKSYGTLTVSEKINDGSGEGDGNGEGDGSGEGDGNGEGDGSGGTAGGTLDGSTIGLPENYDENTEYFVVKNSVKDNIYLKMESYGDYKSTKNGWNKAPVYDKKLSSGASMFFLTSYALDNSGLTPRHVEITPKMQLFALPYYSTGEIIKESTDSAVIGNASQKYSLNYYNWDSTAGIEIPDVYSVDESEYRAFVRSTYCQIDDETLAYMNNIIAGQNFDASSSDIISKVASYIKKSARYNLKYDRSIDSAPNVAIAFLEKKEGICQHYATAATLLYRALGIPARYTVGFAAPTSANAETSVRAKMAHAWVEVYVDKIGWINVEVTGSGNAATGTDKPIELQITPTYTGAVYNAQTLTPHQTVQGMSSLLREGYTYSASITGSNSSLGIKASTVSGFKIYDSFGVLVYDKETGLGSDKFTIKYKTGQIHLYLSELYFTSPTKNKTHYDGTALTFGEEEVTRSGVVGAGYEVSIRSIASLTDAAQALSSFEVEITKDGKVCTDHYRVNYIYGTLTIGKREITLKAGSAERDYNGEALICSDYTVIGTLAVGDAIMEITVSGSQTNVGTAENEVLKDSIVIKNEAGIDVTANYDFSFIKGKLKVNMPPQS